MNYENTENKVKKFCESIYKDAEDYCTNTESILYCTKTEFILSRRTIAFGAVHFASNNLFPQFNSRLSDWWNGEMWHKFQKLIEKNS